MQLAGSIVSHGRLQNGLLAFPDVGLISGRREMYDYFTHNNARVLHRIEGEGKCRVYQPMPHVAVVSDIPKDGEQNRDREGPLEPTPESRPFIWSALFAEWANGNFSRILVMLEAEDTVRVDGDITGGARVMDGPPSGGFAGGLGGFATPGTIMNSGNGFMATVPVGVRMKELREICDHNYEQALVHGRIEGQDSFTVDYPMPGFCLINRDLRLTAREAEPDPSEEPPSGSVPSGSVPSGSPSGSVPSGSPSGPASSPGSPGPPTCHKCASCCFSEDSTLSVTYSTSGTDTSGDCANVPTSGTKTLTFNTKTATFTRWQRVEGDVTYQVSYSCTSEKWNLLVDYVPGVSTTLFFSNGTDDDCCGVSDLSLSSSGCGSSGSGSASITVNGNRCCNNGTACEEGTPNCDGTCAGSPSS